MIPTKSAPRRSPASRWVASMALAAILWLGTAVALTGCAFRDDGRVEWVWPAGPL